MSEDVAVTASTFLNGGVSHFRDLKRDWPLITNSIGSMANQSSNETSPPGGSGGQMMTLSPPAGDGAGMTGSSTAPEATSSASDLSGDAEGVWSVDIDQAFQEALAIYPPCGRRKIIISDEGKMYGRNELIARYIKLRCGKTRTRKQVSSHIQVLARKKLRDEQAKKKSEASILPTNIQLPTSPMSLPSVMATSLKKKSSTSPSSMTSATLAAAAAASTSLSSTSSTASTSSSSSSSSTSSSSLSSSSAAAAAAAAAAVSSSSTTSSAAAVAVTTPFTMTTPVIPKIDQQPTPEQLSQQLLFTSLSSQLWPFQQATGCLPPQLQFGGMDLSQLVAPTTKQDFVAETPKPIATSSLSLLEFSAFVQCNATNNKTDLVRIDNALEDETISISLFYDKYPEVLQQLFDSSPRKDIFFLAKCWANINVPDDVMNFQYAVDSTYVSNEKFHLKVSTMACSFGKQAVEKIEAYPPTESNGQYSFILKNSPMCDYMVKFISELRKLDTIENMNSVLENFTVLQIVTNNETNEALMVICFVFEVSELEPSCSIFRLTA